MKKLLLTLTLCLVSIVTFAQPSKGGFTLSGDYSFFGQKGDDHISIGYFGVEYFVRNNLSLGVGISYDNDDLHYGIQINYFVPIKNSDFYFSIRNFASIKGGKKEFADNIGFTISIAPTFNYDISHRWTIYASVMNVEIGTDPTTYYAVNVNHPKIGFLFNF